MKKIIAALAALMLISSVAYAENTAIVNNEAATVDIDFKCDGASFALIMIKNREYGTYIWAGQEAVSDGKLDFTAKFDSAAKGGDYDVFVTTDNKKSYTASFYYMTADALGDLLDDINDLVDSSDEERVAALTKIIVEKDFVFQYNKDKYTYLDDKDAVAVKMLDENYPTIEEFSKKLESVITELYNIQNDNESAKKLSAASVGEITGILEDYDDVFGITLDDTYYKYKDVVNAEIKSAGIKKADEVYEVYMKAMAIPYVNEADRTDILSVIEAYDEYLGIYDSIIALDGDVQITALKALENGTFKSVSEMEKVISEAKKAVKENVADYSDDDESSSTYKVSQDILDRRVEIIQDIVTDADFEEDKIFTDLDNALWAEEAILALYDMGIVSGKDAKKFAPDDVISRAELVTMLVNAYKPEADNTEEFSDVKSSDWFYKAVMTAKGAGIASGDENNCFNPASSVTRQDMAVLIYRAMGSPEVGETELFADDADISDYAKAAVYYMKEKKIVSGMEDGGFAPSATATRAQCALMLYKALGIENEVK